MILAAISAYYWWWPMLAVTAEAATVNDMVSLGALGTFVKVTLGAAGGLALVFLGKGWGRKTSEVHLKPNPLNVRLDDMPINRGEFREFRKAIDARLTSVETSQIRQMDYVNTKHIELLATIERAAKTGVDGRIALWNHIKPIEREIAELAATSNVTEQLAKLAATLKENSNVRKTAGH